MAAPYRPQAVFATNPPARPPKLWLGLLVSLACRVTAPAEVLPADEPEPPSPAGTWEVAGEMPRGVESFEAVVVGRGSDASLYVLGGWDGGGASDEVHVARLSVQPLRWEAMPSLPYGLELFGLVASGDHLCVLGGFDGEAIHDEIWCSPSVRKAGGDTWTEVGRLPEPRSSAATVTVGDFVYVVGGGQSGEQPARASVYVASRSSLDSLADWRGTTPLDGPRARVTGLSFGGHVVVVGGHDMKGEIVEQVVRARPDAEGELGDWEAVAVLPSPRLGMAAIEDPAGRLLLTGGRADEPVGFDETWSHSGEPGSPFVPGGPLPGPRWGHRLVRHEASILSIGGWHSPKERPSPAIWIY